jgi:uncharacterized protein
MKMAEIMLSCEGVNNMQNDPKITRFEDLFEEKENPKYLKKKPDDNRHYVYALLVYFLIMYVAATILFLGFSQIQAFQEDVSIEERVLNALKSDVNGIVLFNNLDYIDYKDESQDSIVSIGLYKGHSILINKRNQDAFDLLYTSDVSTGETYFDVLEFEKMIGDDAVYFYWSTESGKVMFYQGETLSQPEGLRVPQKIVFTEPTTALSDFGLSIVNFAIYVIMLPLMIFFIRKDLVYDFEEIKMKRQEIIIPIALGYIMIIAGNYVSQLLSQFLAQVFNVTPAEAINQITIINALQSQGAVLMFVSAVLLGPIVEELIFRKAIFGLIKKDHIALIVSTFIFGTIHLISEPSITEALVNGVSYYMMGFVFGYIYLKNDRNIWIPIFVHILSNLISVVAILVLY